MLLTGDIGGTKTNLAVYTPEKGPRAPLVQETFPSNKYRSLEDLVRVFLEKTGRTPSYASFGVAGPVVRGRASVTNLPWEIEETSLQKVFHFKAVRLLNDLEAVANSIPVLGPDDLHVITSGEPVEGGNIGVVAPGTGLGEAFLVWDGERYQAHSSEGGHATFASMNELEGELKTYLMKRFGHVSNERVCSGLGIPNIYNFLKDRKYAPEPGWLAEELNEAADPTPVIVTHAFGEGRNCRLCTETLRLFVSILGGEAGNLALKVLATGGVYLGGGIPPRIIPALDRGGFFEAFCSKGRLKKVLEKIPLYIIMNPKTALLGSACYGLEMIHRDRG